MPFGSQLSCLSFNAIMDRESDFAVIGNYEVNKDDVVIKLRSLNFLVFGFATAVVRWAFSMICFFDFVTWLGHWISSMVQIRGWRTKIS